EAAAEQSGLRAVGVERDAERKHLAGADEARGLDDILRRDLVERADLIVFSPAAPVLELRRRLGDGFLTHLNVHRNASFPLVHMYDFPWRSEGRRRVPASLAQMLGCGH